VAVAAAKVCRATEEFASLPSGQQCKHHCVSKRLRNDLYCVGWGVKLYSVSIKSVHFFSSTITVTSTDLSHICDKLL